MCEHCGFTGKTKDQLTKHKARQHEEKSHICKQCDKAYALVWDLQRHVEVAHLGLYNIVQLSAVVYTIAEVDGPLWVLLKHATVLQIFLVYV